MVITTDILQWAGCATGVAGALLLALNTKHSGWGFVLFLVSNTLWAAFGVLTNAPGLVATQAIFTVTSLLGICRWLVVARHSEESRALGTKQLTNAVLRPAPLRSLKSSATLERL